MKNVCNLSLFSFDDKTFVSFFHECWIMAGSNFWPLFSSHDSPKFSSRSLLLPLGSIQKILQFYVKSFPNALVCKLTHTPNWPKKSWITLKTLRGFFLAAKVESFRELSSRTMSAMDTVLVFPRAMPCHLAKKPQNKSLFRESLLE